MAEHSFDPTDFTADTELLRGANTLPTLSNRLRARVLNAATSAYRQARRWAQARQAASFLSVCLLASFVLSPLANISLPTSASPIDLASLDTLSSPQQRNSAWTLRHDREFLDLPREAPGVGSTIFRNWPAQTSSTSKQSVGQFRKIVDPTPPQHVVQTESSPPRDKLLTALHTSDGWATVQAFQAVRSRSHSTLQRAFAAN